MWGIIRVYVPILTYHKVSNKFEWGINTVPVKTFESQINYLSQKNYYSISLARYIRGDYQSNPEQCPIIITFDDADESVYRYAFPILKSYGFKATLFVISDYVGKINTWDANLGKIYSRHLNWEQIIKLSNEGWEIGSHTATHRDLIGLSSEEVQKELQTSREVIAEKLNQPIRFISYPFNRYDQRIILLAQQVGYSGGCGLPANRKLNGFSSYFNIQRYGVYTIDKLFWFRKKLCNSTLELLKQRMISFAAIGSIWYKQLKK